MKLYLREKDYDKFVELVVVRMGEVFSGKVLESFINYGFILFCVIIVVVVGLGFYIGYKEELECIKCIFKF